MARSRVAVLRTRPETVLEDYERLCELAGMKEALDPGATTILKDNISWHLLYPGANTTPWQLEGTIQALKGAGFLNLRMGRLADAVDRLDKVIELDAVDRIGAVALKDLAIDAMKEDACCEVA